MNKKAYAKAFQIFHDYLKLSRKKEIAYHSALLDIDSKIDLLSSYGGLCDVKEDYDFYCEVKKELIKMYENNR
jgi:hypothetical protein